MNPRIPLIVPLAVLLTLALHAPRTLAQAEDAEAPPAASAPQVDETNADAAADAAVGDAAEAGVADAEDAAKAAAGQFEAGRLLFFQGEFAEAIAKLEAGVAADPKSSYQLLLAKAYRHAGRDNDAAKLLEAILKANPEHVEAGVELAELLSPHKQPDRVIATLSPLLRFKHDYPLFHLLAEAYYQKENLEQARHHFEQAIKLNPQSAGDHEQLANIYLAQQRFAKAAMAYETAGELGIDSATYHFKLASAYFNLRNYLGRITTARVLGGKVGQIDNNLLLIDPVPGRKDEFYVAGPKSAIFQVAKARQMGVEVPQIRFLEANIWQSARRYAKADAIYKELEGKLEETEHALFWFYWAQTALGLGDLDAYLSRLDKAIALEPDLYKPTLADAYVTVADRYHQRGDHSNYIAFLGKAVRESPLSANLHLTLGDAHWQANQRGQAIAQYQLVLELEPDHAQRIRLLNRIRHPDKQPAPAE